MLTDNKTVKVFFKGEYVMVFFDGAVAIVDDKGMVTYSDGRHEKLEPTGLTIEHLARLAYNMGARPTVKVKYVGEDNPDTERMFNQHLGNV